MSWYKDTLGEVSEKIQTGPFGSQLHQSDYRDEGVPVIMPKDMLEGRISTLSIARISKEHVERLNQHKVKSGDIIYSRRGDVGKCALITNKEEGWLCGTGCLKVTLNPNKIIPKFAFYQLQRKESIGWLINHAVGSTMLNLNTSILTKLPIEITDLDKQQSIVNVLASYDDLIENNQKQIELLEESAQRLYKEWFVDLRFPGHENVEIIDGIPVEWEYLEFLDIAPIITGKKDANFSSENGKYLFFTCSQQPLLAESYSYDCDAVILAGNGDFNVKLYRGKFEAYQRTYVLSPYKTEHLYLLFYTIKNRMNYLIQGASGSTIKFLTKGMIADIKVLVPTCEILNQYNEIAESLQRQLEVLTYQNKLLTEARDRLLPKLMSGEIEV